MGIMDRSSFLKVSAASLAAIGVEGTAVDMFARTPSARPEDLSVLFLGTGAADWNGRGQLPFSNARHNVTLCCFVSA